MDNIAPIPRDPKPQATAINFTPPEKEEYMLDPNNPSIVSVTLAGCGGCGINLSRPFLTDPRLNKTLYFDTSMTNTRHGEKANIVTNGSGSGSNRAENALDIERSIPRLSDEALSLGDVVIVAFSLAGGSGSVIGPLLLREYHRRGIRVIGVAVADTSYAVGAKNTHNTLKTLNSICNNNEIYLPMILLSNDQAPNRGAVDSAAAFVMHDLIDILTKPVYEVDRNDRMNWINPTKVVDSGYGLKLMTFISDKNTGLSKIVLGTDSAEMVDSLLITQSTPDEQPVDRDKLPPARLKKTGFYYESYRPIIGKVTSDISSIEGIIDYVEKMQNTDRSQKHRTVNRLAAQSADDLIL